MPGFNEVILMGKLVFDPDLRYANSFPVCQMRLVVPRRYKNKDDEWKSDSLFIDIQIWRHMAEICAQKLKKGSQIMVAGRLQLNEWKDKEGRPRQTYRVQAQRIQFLDKPAPDPETEPQPEEAGTEAA